MADYNIVLSQLHWRIWQDELGLSGTISEYGHIKFGRQGPGILTVLVTGTDSATVNYRIVDDYFHTCLTTESALAVCNSVNIFSSGATLVADAAAIEVNVHLYYIPLDDTGALPDEGILSAWIGPSMTEIENATKAFALELKKQPQ